MRRRYWAPAAALAAALATASLSACSTSTAARPALPCAGHMCILSIQNDAATDLAVRFADSSGRVGVLGLVAPRTVRAFRVQWIRSAGVRLIVLTRNGQLFNADIALQPVQATEVHFPADFRVADDDVAAPKVRAKADSIKP